MNFIDLQGWMILQEKAEMIAWRIMKDLGVTLIL